MPAGFLEKEAAAAVACVGLGAAGVIVDAVVAGGGVARTGKAVLVVALCAVEFAVALVGSVEFVVHFVVALSWLVVVSVVLIVEDLG